MQDPIEDQPYWHVPKDVVGSAEHIAAAKDAAEQGMVLLRNERRYNSAISSAVLRVVRMHVESFC